MKINFLVVTVGLVVGLGLVLLVAFSAPESAPAAGETRIANGARAPEPPPVRRPAGPSGQTGASSTAPALAAAYEVELHIERIGDLDSSAEQSAFHGIFAGALQGTVSDAAELPLSGLAVSIGSGPSRGRRASTDVRGRYRLEGLAPGWTLVRFAPSGGPAQIHQVLVPGSGMVTKNLVIRPPASLWGRVMSYSGKGIEGARIEVGEVAASSDRHGDFSMDGVPAGSDTLIYVSAPGHASQRLKAVVPPLGGAGGKGFQIVMMRGVTLKVRLRGFPPPIPPRVSILPMPNYARANVPYERFEDLEAPCDGVLQVPGLPANTILRVRVDHPAVSAGDGWRFVPVTQSDPRPVEFRANPQGSTSLRGKVVSARDGHPIAGATLRIEPAGVRELLAQRVEEVLWNQVVPPSFSSLSALFESRRDGSFEVALAFAPPYRLRVEAPGWEPGVLRIGAAGTEELVRLSPRAPARPCELRLRLRPRRPFRYRVYLGGSSEPLRGASPGGDDCAVATLEPGIYRVGRALSDLQLVPLDLVVPGGGKPLSVVVSLIGED